MEECEKQKICRTCLSENGEFQSVFVPEATSGLPQHLSEMLTACASVQITLGDGLPEQICSSCATNTVNMYLFKLKCEKSDTILRERLQKVSVYYEQDILENNTKENNGDIIKPEINVDSDTKLCQSETILEDFDNFDFDTYKSDSEEDFPDIVNESDINTEMTLKQQNKVKEFQCEICLKRFSRNDLLIRHKIAHAMKMDDEKVEFDGTFQMEENDHNLMRIKSEEFMYTCSDCDVFFIQKEDLDNHMAQEHDKKDGVFKCDVCTKSYSKMAHLNRHLKTHYTEKAYKCPHCEKSFIRQEQLNHHMNIHSGIKPHTCDICFKDVSQNKSVRQHLRQEWDEKAMQAAMNSIREKKMGWQLAAKTFNIPATTLRRRFKTGDSSKGDLGGRRTVLPRDMEKELVNHIVDMETRFFRFTAKDLRRLVYQIAESNNLKNNFSKEDMMAGRKWISGFVRRNPSISLQIPENTSSARTQAFNRNNIRSYFSALDATLQKYNFPPENIFNVDEISLNTVQKKPQKMFVTRGCKEVGTLSNAEHDKHITVACAMNAIGTFIPPVFIFSGKTFKNELMDNAPPGSKAYCQEKGWMTGELFLMWLQHFVHHTKASIDNKVLLLLDGYSSHKYLAVLEFAKEHGVVMFCFPAHCSHRVQPLDVGFFGPLQTHYDQEVQAWLSKNHGRVVTDFQVAGIFKNAFLNCAMPSIAINSFKKTGIVPYNPDVFEDWMFASSISTDKLMEDPNLQQEVNEDSLKQSTSASDPNSARNCNTAKEPDLQVENYEPPQKLTQSVVSDIAGPSIQELKCSIANFTPTSVLVVKSDGKGKRKRGKTVMLNSNDTKQMEYVKVVRERKKLARQAKKKIVVEEESSDSDTNNDPWSAIDDHNSDVGCIYCNEFFSESHFNEMWIQCQSCNAWCHNECAGVGTKTKKFVCELCTHLCNYV